MDDRLESGQLAIIDRSKAGAKRAIQTVARVRPLDAQVVSEYSSIREMRARGCLQRACEGRSRDFVDKKQV